MALTFRGQANAKEQAQETGKVNGNGEESRGGILESGEGHGQEGEGSSRPDYSFGARPGGGGACWGQTRWAGRRAGSPLLHRALSELEGEGWGEDSGKQEVGVTAAQWRLGEEPGVTTGACTEGGFCA